MSGRPLEGGALPGAHCQRRLTPPSGYCLPVARCPWLGMGLHAHLPSSGWVFVWLEVVQVSCTHSHCEFSCPAVPGKHCSPTMIPEPWEEGCDMAVLLKAGHSLVLLVLSLLLTTICGRGTVLWWGLKDIPISGYKDKSLEVTVTLWPFSKE